MSQTSIRHGRTGEGRVQYKISGHTICTVRVKAGPCLACLLPRCSPGQLCAYPGGLSSPRDGLKWLWALGLALAVGSSTASAAVEDGRAGMGFSTSSQTQREVHFVSHLKL